MKTLRQGHINEEIVGILRMEENHLEKGEDYFYDPELDTFWKEDGSIGYARNTVRLADGVWLRVIPVNEEYHSENIWKLVKQPFIKKTKTV